MLSSLLYLFKYFIFYPLTTMNQIDKTKRNKNLYSERHNGFDRSVRTRILLEDGVGGFIDDNE